MRTYQSGWVSFWGHKNARSWEQHLLICTQILAKKDARSNGYGVYMGEECIGIWVLGGICKSGG